MSDDITKLCADTLRSHTENNYGVRIKSSHAHELVAAYFGYQSRAALLADIKHPLSNLRKASVIVLHPTAPIEERRKSLQGLPSDLPDTYTLGEGVYSGLVTENWVLSEPWPTFELLAISLADEYLRSQKMQKIYSAPTREGVRVERNDDGVRLTVLRFYQIPTTSGQIQELDVITTIDLARIAGHIGYSGPEVSVTMEPLESRA